MRWSRSRSIAALLVLGMALTVWASIGRVLGQQGAAQGRSYRDAIQARPTTQEELVARAWGQEAPIVPHPLVNQTMVFSEMKAEPGEGAVSLTARVRVFDRVPGNQYVWLLRVFATKPSKQLLREHHYLENVVFLPDGQTQMAPTFQDFVGLNPGTYQLQLSLYAVPQGFPFDQVKRGEDMLPKAVALVFRSVKVVIPK